MDIIPTHGTPSPDVLVDMIKYQLGMELRDEDARRDIFLCLAVSMPAARQVVYRNALGPLLARARMRSLRRDLSSEDDPHVLLSNDLQTHMEDLSLPLQLERRIGVASTLLVLGCQSLFRFMFRSLFILLRFLFPPGVSCAFRRFKRSMYKAAEQLRRLGRM